ncbi:MAG TPA: PIN domain-containing protein [Dehalococcoidia bacterium]|nr:PIN domain-containing protein [Dehalococcoidia bacterium]
MNGLLDTSMVVRYLTGDPPELADRAAQVIDAVDRLGVTGVVLAETAYVLTSVYGVPRAVVVDHLIAFVQKKNIATVGLDKGAVLQALLLCRPSGRVSFADAMVWAAAQSSGVGVVYTLDERFPADGLELRTGPQS